MEILRTPLNATSLIQLVVYDVIRLAIAHTLISLLRQTNGKGGQHRVSSRGQAQALLNWGLLLIRLGW